MKPERKKNTKHEDQIRARKKEPEEIVFSQIFLLKHQKDHQIKKSTETDLIVHKKQ